MTAIAARYPFSVPHLHSMASKVCALAFSMALWISLTVSCASGLPVLWNGTVKGEGEKNVGKSLPGNRNAFSLTCASHEVQCMRQNMTLLTSSSKYSLLLIYY